MKLILDQLQYKDCIFIIDTRGNRVYYESVDGHWEKRGYNDRNRRVSCEDSFGHWSKSEYDVHGNRTSWTTQDYWWKKEYDEFGIETSFIDSLGSTEHPV